MVEGVKAETADRFFVAIPLPPEVRLAVDDWRAGLDLPGRMVPMRNLHVTLRFVGPAGQVGQDRIVAGLDAADLVGPFSFRIGGLGAFPKLHKATVAWAALERDEGEVSRLAGVVEEAVAAAGFGYDERPFRSHLTLARIRPPRDLRGPAGGRPAGIEVPVTEVVFYRSRSEGRSTIYEPVERFPLPRN